MRMIIIALIVTILLSGCSVPSTEETDQNLLDGISMSWSSKLEHYGKVFSIVINKTSGMVKSVKHENL